MSLSNLDKQNLKGYQKLKFDGGIWLDDGYVKKNVVKDNVLGLQVYKLYCQDINCIIVNFGWVPYQNKINLDAMHPNKTIHGVVRSLPYVLINEQAPLELYQGFGSIVSLDTKFLSNITHRNVLPYEMLIDESLTDYQQLTSLPKISVQRHYGYAVQFYLLALVLAIGYIYLRK